MLGGRCVFALASLANLNDERSLSATARGIGLSEALDWHVMGYALQ